MESRSLALSRIEKILSRDKSVIDFDKGEEFQMPDIDYGLFDQNPTHTASGLDAIGKYIAAPYYVLKFRDSTECKVWKYFKARKYDWFEEFDESCSITFNSIFGVTMHLDSLARQYHGQNKEELVKLCNQVKACQEDYRNIAPTQKVQRVKEIKRTLRALVGILSNASQN